MAFLNEKIREVQKFKDWMDRIQNVYRGDEAKMSRAFDKFLPEQMRGL